MKDKMPYISDNKNNEPDPEYKYPMLIVVFVIICLYFFAWKFFVNI